ncbi:Uncharacterised protein [Halioglobus japonicus]|nr:Uncharacterised protein [Halioglobus japonicus]
MAAIQTHKHSNVVVLRHCDDIYGEHTARNTTEVLEQIHVAYTCYEISQPLPELNGFVAVLLCTERLDQAVAGLAESLECFVEQGGGLVVVHRGFKENFCKLFGIVSQDHLVSVTSDYGAAGLVFPSRVLPSFQGLALDASAIDGHASFDVVPVADARIVATSSTGKPLAWRSRHGKGYVLYWNTTICSEKRMRGLIVESLESVVPVMVLPTANAGVVQIDDFPAPLPAPSVELGGTSQVDQFYSHRWWPDVYRLANGYDIALSCFVAFDYSNVPVDAAAVRAQTALATVESDNIAAILRLPPAEIGLHGYNHLPLTVTDWADQSEMARSLEQAIAEWTRAGFGPLPTSYVPPMNIYDRNGIAVLTKTLPGITSISSVLNGALGGATERDFGPEPWNESLFCLPRATCGHECSQQLLFDCANQVAALGVWTHFLHPDDLVDVPGPGKLQSAARNPYSKPWRGRRGKRGLYDELAEIFVQVRSRFPWLVFRSTSEAVEILRPFLLNDWQVDYSDERVVVNGPVGGFFRLRTNGVPRVRAGRCEGARIVHLDTADDYRLYVIEMQATRADISLDTEMTWQGLFERISAALPRSWHPSMN